MDSTKVSSILRWAQPMSVEGVRGFLRLTSYYRRVVKDYGNIAHPFNQLLKKENASTFQWNDEASNAHLHLQKALISALVLAMPDFFQTIFVGVSCIWEGIRSSVNARQTPHCFF